MVKKETTKKAAPKKKKVIAKNEEPVIITNGEQESAPTVEDTEKTLESLNENKVVADNDKIKNDEDISEENVETINETPVEAIMEEQEEVEPTPKKIVHHTENKQKKNIISRVFGYLWNGQEMDI